MDQEPKIKGNQEEQMCLHCGQKHNLFEDNNCHRELVDDYQEYVAKLDIAHEDKNILLKKFVNLNSNDAFKLLNEVKGREGKNTRETASRAGEYYSKEYGFTKEENIDSEKGEEKERVCSRCFKKLSIYNNSDECFSHEDDVSDEERMNRFINDLSIEDMIMLKIFFESNEENREEILKKIIAKKNKRENID